MDAFPNWLVGLGAGVLAATLIELAALLLGRLLRTFRVGMVFHWWALSSVVFFTIHRAIPDERGKLSLWAFSSSALLLLTAMALFSVVNQLVLSRPREPGGAPRIPGLVRSVARLILALAVAATAASVFHKVAWSTVVLSSTVISAVLGFALQDVLKNIFAGMSMQIEGVPRTGDWLLTEDGSAQVVEMSWRTTHLRNNEGVDIREPNSVIAQQKLINYGSGREPVGFLFEVGLPYSVPPAQIKEALMRAARSVPAVEERPSPLVFLEGFDDSAILYRLRVWTRQVQRQAVFRDAVRSRIWYELHRAGISVPFPIRTVEMHDASKEEQIAKESAFSRAAGLLGRVPLFAELGKERIAEIAAAARRQHFDDGETLIREGESGDSLWLISAGAAKVSARKGARSVELAKLASGDFLGEMALLTESQRTATVTADGPCEVLIIDRSCLQPILDREPGLVQVLAKALAERSEASEEKLEAAPGTLVREVASEASFISRIQRLFRIPG